MVTFVGINLKPNFSKYQLNNTRGLNGERDKKRMMKTSTSVKSVGLHIKKEDGLNSVRNSALNIIHVHWKLQDMLSE